jgi:hypothetical protein
MRKTASWALGVAILVILGSVPAAFAAGEAQTAKNAGPKGVGQADVTLKVKGKNYKLGYAAAFVDQRDKDKPVVLLITDVQVPASDWASDFDFMRYKVDHKVSGAIFWLDGKRQVFRGEIDAEGNSTSVSGMWELKFDGAPGKSLIGSVSTDPNTDKQMFPYFAEGTFNAILK